MERLQKVLQKAGVASRRKAEVWIAEGKVAVDGVVVTDLGVKVSSQAEVRVMGELLKREAMVYYILNKPPGYVSTTSDPLGRKTLMDLIPVQQRIFPVGRLDYDTSGLVLLTNDGEFMNRLLHPRYKIEKEYHVKVEGLLRKEESQRLTRGMDLGDFVSQPAKIIEVRYDDKKVNTYVKIIITEGKYHQIKRMFEAINHPILKLKRYRLGNITIEDLGLGHYRALKPHELKLLWNLSTFGKDGIND
jgi:23S rRNA pseudouridine2605 synthase